MSYKRLLIVLMLCSCSATRMIQTDIYFGQSKPDGGMVTESEWKDFKETRIANVFPEGSTVFSALGNWFDPEARRLVTEPTYVVVYYYKPSSQISKQIDSLRYWYKTQFNQQSVLRVDKKVKASF
jgi:hypothetical protein